MTILVVSVLVGLAFTFLSVQNTQGVTFRLGGYIWQNVPLYLISIGSLLIGIVVSWLISMVDVVSSTLQIRGKENQIKKTEQNLHDLHNRIRELELENAQLKGTHEQHETVVEEASESHQNPQTLADYHERRKNWFERIRHNLSW